jgi:pilus assembly protein FimV
MRRSGFILAMLLAVPLAAPAAGLGRLAVMSRVGEPLNAEIEVVSVQGNEGESLAARVAPPEVYRSAHVAPVPPVDALRAEIVRRPDGRPAVKVTSTGPVEKPLVNLLVELSWAGGNPVVRQYSFLLDTLDRKPPPVVFTPTPSDAAAPKPAEPAPPPAAAPAVPLEAARAPAIPEAGGTYAVQPGDSLLKIAQTTRYDGVTFPQMVVAIHRANEDAFIGGDMSRLKGGRTLKIPARDEVAAVNAEEARQTLAALRGQPAEAARRPAPAEPGPTGDDIVARERALTESRERAAALEQTRDDLKRLIEAREKEIAELERQVGKAAGKSQPIKKPAP